MARTIGERVKCSQCAAARNCFLVAMRAGATRNLSRKHSVSACPKGTTVFKEGQRPGSLAVLCQGRVKLSVGSNGHQQVLRVVHPGEVIGLSTAISGNQHEETAETTTNSRLVFIGRNHLLQCLQAHAEAWIRVVEFLSEDVRSAEGCLWKLAQGRAKVSN